MGDEMKGEWLTNHDVTDLGPADLSIDRPLFGQPIPMGKAGEPMTDTTPVEKE